MYIYNIITYHIMRERRDIDIDIDIDI